MICCCCCLSPFEPIYHVPVVANIIKAVSHSSSRKIFLFPNLRRQKRPCCRQATSRGAHSIVVCQSSIDCCPRGLRRKEAFQDGDDSRVVHGPRDVERTGVEQQQHHWLPTSCREANHSCFSCLMKYFGVRLLDAPISSLEESIYITRMRTES